MQSNAPLMSRRELTERFNAEFDTNKTVLSIKSWCNARGYHAPSDGRFTKGHISWQTGLSGDDFKSHYSDESFQRMIASAIRGNRRHKIGDKTVRHGVPFIVTSIEPGVSLDRRGSPQRRVVWEQLHGAIPKDHCVICLDRNQMNCDPSNLYCMPIRYRTILAKNKWWFEDADLTLAAIKWCELHDAIKDADI